MADTQRKQQNEFLRDFRNEFIRRQDDLSKQLSDMETIFMEGRTPPSPLKIPSSNNPDKSETSNRSGGIDITPNRGTFITALSSAMKPGPKQIIIAMHELKMSIPHNTVVLEYGFEIDGVASHSTTVRDALARELGQYNMIRYDEDTGAIKLSSNGEEFAQWLIDNDFKASFFECNALNASWGTPSPQYHDLISHILFESAKKTANKTNEGTP